VAKQLPEVPVSGYRTAAGKEPVLDGCAALIKKTETKSSSWSGGIKLLAFGRGVRFSACRASSLPQRVVDPSAVPVGNTMASEVLQACRMSFLTKRDS
jgi:hypothetical protein